MAVSAPAPSAAKTISLVRARLSAGRITRLPLLKYHLVVLLLLFAMAPQALVPPQVDRASARIHCENLKLFT
jgi:hypothetical protein